MKTQLKILMIAFLSLILSNQLSAQSSSEQAKIVLPSTNEIIIGTDLNIDTQGDKTIISINVKARKNERIRIPNPPPQAQISTACGITIPQAHWGFKNSLCGTLYTDPTQFGNTYFITCVGSWGSLCALLY